MDERLQVPYCDVYPVSMYDHSIIVKLNNLCLIRLGITLLSLGQVRLLSLLSFLYYLFLFLDDFIPMDIHHSMFALRNLKKNPNPALPVAHDPSGQAQSRVGVWDLMPAWQARISSGIHWDLIPAWQARISSHLTSCLVILRIHERTITQHFKTNPV